MTEINSLNNDDLQVLKEIGELSRFKTPVPDKSATTNKGFCYTTENNKIVELTLISSGVSNLPESIGNLNSLRILILKGNGLSAIPESIEKLTSLQTLDISGNMLKTLPSSIGNLKTEIQKKPARLLDLTIRNVERVGL